MHFWLQIYGLIVSNWKAIQLFLLGFYPHVSIVTAFLKKEPPVYIKDYHIWVDSGGMPSIHQHWLWDTYTQTVFASFSFTPPRRTYLVLAYWWTIHGTQTCDLTICLCFRPIKPLKPSNAFSLACWDFHPHTNQSRDVVLCIICNQGAQLSLWNSWFLSHPRR